MLLVTFDSFLTIPVGSEVATDKGTWSYINMSITACIGVLAVAFGEVSAEGNTLVSRLVGEIAAAALLATLLLEEVLADGNFLRVVGESARSTKVALTYD